MYHVAVAVVREDERLFDKLDTVRSLPASPESARVTVVHISDGESETVPSVSKAVRGLENAENAADAHCREGDESAAALVEVADELGVDLLCIGGRRRSPAGKLQLKPGAQEVLLTAPCPVVVAGTVESRKPRTSP